MELAGLEPYPCLLLVQYHEFGLLFSFVFSFLLMSLHSFAVLPDFYKIEFESFTDALQFIIDGFALYLSLVLIFCLLDFEYVSF